jgi:hypothetical protein
MHLTYQQQVITEVTSPYRHPFIPVSVWQLIDRPVPMTKLRSSVWSIHIDGYKTVKSYARFINMSPICPRCQQAAESMEHALVECQEVYASWSRPCQVFTAQLTQHTFYLIIIYYQESTRTVEYWCLFTGFNMWIVGDTLRSAPSSFFLNKINTDASWRVKVNAEKYPNSKTVYFHGTQYIKIVRQCSGIILVTYMMIITSVNYQDIIE